MRSEKGAEIGEQRAERSEGNFLLKAPREVRREQSAESRKQRK